MALLPPFISSHSANVSISAPFPPPGFLPFLSSQSRTSPSLAASLLGGNPGLRVRLGRGIPAPGATSPSLPAAACCPSHVRRLLSASAAVTQWLPPIQSLFLSQHFTGARCAFVHQLKKNKKTDYRKQSQAGGEVQKPAGKEQSGAGWPQPQPCLALGFVWISPAR